MNWSKVKTILIILFLFTDIFLGVSIYGSSRKELKTSPEVIDAAVNILEKNGIMVDKSVIDTKRQYATVFQADNVISDYSVFAAYFLGDNMAAADGNIFTSERGTVSFDNDSFSFDPNSASKSSSAISQNDTKRFVKKFLQDSGFDISHAKITFGSFENASYNIEIRDYYDRKPIFSSVLLLNATENAIISARGSWFNIKDGSQPQENIVKSTYGLLVDFMTEYSGVRPVTVLSAELGYKVFESENYHKSASLIPVLKITLSDNSEYYMDSRNEN